MVAEKTDCGFHRFPNPLAIAQRINFYAELSTKRQVQDLVLSESSRSARRPSQLFQSKTWTSSSDPVGSWRTTPPCRLVQGVVLRRDVARIYLISLPEPLGSRFTRNGTGVHQGTVSPETAMSPGYWQEFVDRTSAISLPYSQPSVRVPFEDLIQGLASCRSSIGQFRRVVIYHNDTDITSQS